MKINDEFYWPVYTKDYAEQLKTMKNEGQDFFITHYVESRDEEFNRQDLAFANRIHANWRELYINAFNLAPASIYECGCGGGYQLKNLHRLLPDATIAGSDLLQSQLDFGFYFSDLPESIYKNLSVVDFTKEVDGSRKFEFVYTHAVIMHLNTENARAFLKNMGKISSKYIFLIEGIRNHDNWFGMVQEALPDFNFSRVGKYIDNAILLTRKA